MSDSNVFRTKRAYRELTSDDKAKPGEIVVDQGHMYFVPCPASASQDSVDQELIKLANGDEMAQGLEGLGIFRTSTSTSTSTTSITLSTITIPTGRSVKIGDLIIGNSTYSYLYRVTAVSSSTATVTYLTSLRGATGATGAAGADGEDAEPYTLPIANSVALGGVKTGYSSSGSYYGLLADSTGNAYTAVPWQGVVSGISTQSLSGYSSITKNYLYLKKALPLYPNGTGNEILINWGWVTTTNKTATITYARSYSSEYTVNVFTSIVTTSDTQTTRISPNTRSGTGFSCPYNTGQQFFYLAIGYR